MKLTDAPIDLSLAFERQRAAWSAAPCPDWAERADRLRRLKRILVEHEAAISQAIDADFGGRPAIETELAEVWPSLEEIKGALRHGRRWMKPRRAGVGKWFQPARAQVLPQPLGVVGIIVPWNYPLFLSAGPLVAALAAGNRVMMKMSEFTPAFGELFAQLIASSFADDQVAVVNGGVDVAQAFAATSFDHLLFTGSTSVGHQIMRAAAEHLTPVTLELGGKSPAIIAPGFPIGEAARRIVWGKCLNAGQTCIAPDYVLLPEQPEHNVHAFIDAARDEVRRLYPDGAAGADYSAIINTRHYQRLRDTLNEAVAKGARAVALAGGESESSRKIAPTIVTGAADDTRLLRDEIFGPLLPLKTYRDLGDALRYVADHPRPLAMYYFDNDRVRIRRVLDESMSGNVTVNDTILHIAQSELPFGGVGASGMGQYHGEDGFNTFSKRKGVFVQSRFNNTWLLKPPFGRRVERMLKLMLR